MKLAKDCFDIGLYTNQREAQLSFWQDDVGLPFDVLLKLGGGSHQLRHDLLGSVLKLNHTRAELPDTGQTGYDILYIAREGLQEQEQHLSGPDGIRVCLVQPGYLDVEQMGIKLRVRDLEKSADFYGRIMGFQILGENRFKLGRSVLMLEQDSAFKPATELKGTGFRYLTIQVWQVDEDHRQIIERGGQEGAPPYTLGDTARISFVKDPDDNWIEISQRASLTGDLPDKAPDTDYQQKF